MCLIWMSHEQLRLKQHQTWKKFTYPAEGREEMVYKRFDHYMGIIE